MIVPKLFNKKSILTEVYMSPGLSLNWLGSNTACQFYTRYCQLLHICELAKPFTPIFSFKDNGSKNFFADNKSKDSISNKFEYLPKSNLRNW